MGKENLIIVVERHYTNVNFRNENIFICRFVFHFLFM